MKSCQRDLPSVSDIIKNAVKIRKIIPYGEKEGMMVLESADNNFQEVEFAEKSNISLINVDEHILGSFPITGSYDLLYGFSYPYKLENICLRFSCGKNSTNYPNTKIKVYKLHIMPDQDTDNIYHYRFFEPLPILSIPRGISFEFTIESTKIIRYPIIIHGSYLNNIAMSKFGIKSMVWHADCDNIFNIKGGKIDGEFDYEDTILSPVFQQEISDNKYINVYCGDHDEKVDVPIGHQIETFTIVGIDKTFSLVYPE